MTRVAARTLNPRINSILVIFLVASFTLTGFINPVSASPAVLELDPNSTSTTDAAVGGTGCVGNTCTVTTQFAVGVVITTVSTSDWVDDLFAFQFVLTFDPSKLTAQAISGTTVEFGTQAAHNWKGFLDTFQAFSFASVDNTAGKVTVAYSLLAPQPGRDITAPTILARVNFEIDTAVSSPGTSISLSDVLLVTDEVATISTSTREFVIYDADNTMTFTAGDTVIVGRTGFPSTNTATLDDPKVKFIDRTIPANNVWDNIVGNPDPIVYDSDNDGFYDLGEPLIFVNETAPALGTPLIDDAKIRFGESSGGDGLYTFGAVIAIGGAVAEVITNNPPVARFTFTPSNPVPPSPLGMTTVTFDLSASSDAEDAGGIPTGFFMDFSDGLGEQDVTTLPGWSPATRTVSYTFDTTDPTQVFDVTLRVVDSAGATGLARDFLGNVIMDDQPSHTVRTVIIDNRPNPRFAFTFADTNSNSWIEVDETVTFDASASSDPDPDGSLTKFEWSFGDGTTALGGVWDTGKSVVYDSNLNGLYDTGEALIAEATPPAGTVLTTDPKVRFLDSNGNNAWDSGESVVYDSNNNSFYDTNEPLIAGTAPPTNLALATDSKIRFADSIISHRYASFGDKSVTLTVTDDLGITNSTTKTVSINAPPTASFTASKTTVVRGEVITFDASATADPDGTSLTYTWDFGDTATGSGVTTTHSYNTLGTFNARLTVADDKNAAESSSTSISVVNLSPLVSFTEDKTTAFRGELITLTITSSDPDGSILTTRVDWGDGEGDTFTGTTATATHTYDNEGTYTVTITVTDNNGLTKTSSTTLTITPAPGPSFPLPGGPLPWAIILAVAAFALVWFALRRRRSRSVPQPPATTKGASFPLTQGFTGQFPGAYRQPKVDEDSS